MRRALTVSAEMDVKRVIIKHHDVGMAYACFGRGPAQGCPMDSSRISDLRNPFGPQVQVRKVVEFLERLIHTS